MQEKQNNKNGQTGLINHIYVHIYSKKTHATEQFVLSQKRCENALSEANCVVLGDMAAKDCQTQTHLTVEVLLISALAPRLNGQHLFGCVFWQSGGIRLPCSFPFIWVCILAKWWNTPTLLLPLLHISISLSLYIYGIILLHVVPIITYKQVCN